MHRIIGYLISGVAGALAIIPHAHASLLGATADFSESLDAAYYRHAGPLVLQSPGRAIDGTVELSSANVTSNPSRYQGELVATLGDTTLTLAPDVFNDYQTITFTVTNITGAPDIVDVVATGSGAIDVASSAPFTRNISFTANSLSVTYAVNSPGTGDEFFLNSSGFDTFAITTAATGGSTSVPEPTTLTMLLPCLAWAGIRSVRRRNQPGLRV